MGLGDAATLANGSGFFFFFLRRMNRAIRAREPLNVKRAQGGGGCVVVVEVGGGWVVLHLCHAFGVHPRCSLCVLQERE